MQALLRRALLALALGSAAAPALAEESGWSTVDLTAIDGKALETEALRGRVVLVVNVASFCSFTPQYSELQMLHDAYAAQGFTVVGVPSNQFGGQEPGSDREIKNFCSTRYGITFPLLTKQDVNGDTRSPLYRWLVSSEVGANRDVGWNFEKFLVDRTGRVIGRFPSHITPQDGNLKAAIEMALSQDS